MEGIDIAELGSFLAFVWATYWKLDGMDERLQRIESRQSLIHVNLKNQAYADSSEDSLPEEPISE